MCLARDRVLLLCVGALLLAWHGHSSRAMAEVGSPWAQGHKTKARLIAGDVDGRALAFVEIELAPGWKTYWRNPGDAGGLPPSFRWDGSQNLAAATVLYPAPTKMTDKAGDVIGYKGGVIFPVELQRETADKAAVLALELSYGICKEICVPVDLSLALEVPSGPLGPASSGMREAVSSVPRAKPNLQPGDPVLTKAQAVLDGDKPAIRVEATFPGDASGAEVYLYAPDGLFVPHPLRVEDLGGGRLIFEALLDPNAGVEELKGKEITATLVGPSGASEERFVLE